MPALGEIKKGFEIGYKGNTKFIWHSCEGCGRERWVKMLRLKPEAERCPQCASKVQRGSNHYNWKGGTARYILIRLKPTDFFFPMANINGEVREHRLIIAHHLKRCLLSWEIVHHINGNKKDNRLENLRLIKGVVDHNGFTALQQENKQLRKRIAQLEAAVG